MDSLRPMALTPCSENNAYSNLQYVIQGGMTSSHSAAPLVLLVLISLQCEFLLVAHDAVPDICLYNNSILLQCRQVFPAIRPEDTGLVAKELSMISNAIGLIGSTSNPQSVIRLLSYGASNFSPSKVCLNCFHANLLQACIASKMYNYATEYLDNNPILEVDPESTHIMASDYLKYFYYGALCYIGKERYQNAIDFLIQAVTLPASALSEIVIFALKKLILLTLITSNSKFVLPKNTPNIVSRFYKSMEKASQASSIEAHSAASAYPIIHSIPEVYDQLITAYTNNDYDALNNHLMNHNDYISVLQQDQNHGLATVLLQSLIKNRIKKLTTAYITLSLSDIQRMCDPHNSCNTEDLVRAMINSNEINAKIDHRTSIVRFNTNTDSGNDTKDIRNSIILLQNYMGEAIGLSDRVHKLTTQVQTSADYLKILSSSSRGGYGADDADLMDDM